ncbi:hypothetical protein MKK68_26270 [Methylobacterium sp. E-016]|nr:hypothetical protein [Methylobacterium sp. E-016]MCJ2079096.1 hypothetical protein [Methylobacterium sp. E-016]
MDFRRVRAAGWSVIARGQAFKADHRGGVAVIFSLTAVVLLGLAGGGIDFARLANRKV